MNQIDEIRRRAYAIARTGRHMDPRSVEAELQRQGYEAVCQALWDPSVRKFLKRLCEEHWREDTSLVGDQLALGCPEYLAHTTREET